VLRLLQEEAMKEGTAALHAQVPVDVATFLLNEKRHDIAKIESRLKVNLILIPNKNLETPHHHIERLRHDDPRLEDNKTSIELVTQPKRLPPGPPAAPKKQVRVPRRWSRASLIRSRHPAMSSPLPPRRLRRRKRPAVCSSGCSAGWLARQQRLPPSSSRPLPTPNPLPPTASALRAATSGGNARWAVNAPASAATSAAPTPKSRLPNMSRPSRAGRPCPRLHAPRKSCSARPRSQRLRQARPLAQLQQTAVAATAAGAAATAAKMG